MADPLQRGPPGPHPGQPDDGPLAETVLAAALLRSPRQPRALLSERRAGDALNEYIHHTGSAVFAVPPGLRPGQHYGDVLFR